MVLLETTRGQVGQDVATQAQLKPNTPGCYSIFDVVRYMDDMPQSVGIHGKQSFQLCT